jgi:hypothetical protein
MQAIEEENKETSSVNSKGSFDFETVPLLQPEVTITMATTTPTTPTLTTPTPTTPTPTGTTTAPTAAATASAFTLGGRSYTPQAVTNPKTISDETDKVLHKKDDRANLTADDDIEPLYLRKQ